MSLCVALMAHSDESTSKLVIVVCTVRRYLLNMGLRQARQLIELLVQYRVRIFVFNGLDNVTTTLICITSTKAIASCDITH